MLGQKINFKVKNKKKLTTANENKCITSLLCVFDRIIYF